MRTASGVLKLAPLIGFETKLRTIAVENIGPIASAWATAAGVPRRRLPSSPPFAGGAGASAMVSSLVFGRKRGYIRRSTRTGQGPRDQRVPAEPASVCKVHEPVIEPLADRPAAHPERRRPRVRSSPGADPDRRHSAWNAAAPGGAGRGAGRLADTPPRGARRLSAEGFVEFSPNLGATVTQLDLGDMRHAWLARIALEPGAARLAAGAADPGGHARMRHAVEQQRTAGDDRTAGFAANRRLPPRPRRRRGKSPPGALRRGALASPDRRPIYQAQAAGRPATAAWADEHDRIIRRRGRGRRGHGGNTYRTDIAACPPVVRH